jgi:hypothetical protein
MYYLLETHTHFVRQSRVLVQLAPFKAVKSSACTQLVGRKDRQDDDSIQLLCFVVLMSHVLSSLITFIKQTIGPMGKKGKGKQAGNFPSKSMRAAFCTEWQAIANEVDVQKLVSSITMKTIVGLLLLSLVCLLRL